MLRPRESRDLKLISSELTVTPAAQITWAHDIFGNSVATATFQWATDSLIIDSLADLELHGSAWPVFDIAASAICDALHLKSRCGAVTAPPVP